MVGPRANAVDWLDHTQIRHVAVAAAKEVLTGGVARSRRVCCQRKGAGKAGLQEALNAVQML